MAVKFTDIKKWDDIWFSQLTMEQKVMFMYLCDACDIAGFLEVNHKLTTLRTGIQDVNEAINSLSKSIVYKDGYIWIKKHIKHQRNLPLNPKNGAHKAIIKSIAEHVDRFPEVYEELSSSDLSIIQRELGGGWGEGRPPISNSISNSISNTVTTDTPQEETKITRLYKFFVGEENLMGQSIAGGMREILAEALQVMDVEKWRIYCEARLVDEYKASPKKFFLEDGWRRYQDNVKKVVKEENYNKSKVKEAKERAELPEQEAPEDFKEFVDNFGKRVKRDTEIQSDTA